LGKKVAILAERRKKQKKKGGKMGCQENVFEKKKATSNLEIKKK